MKDIKKSASFTSKQRGKDVKFNIDLNYSPEYDSFIIRVKQGEGFMAYSSNIERMPLEVIQKLNEMLEEVLIQAGSKTEIKEHKMFDGGNFQSGVYAKGGSLTELNKKVMSYDKPIKYRGSIYPNIYGASFRNTVAGTQKGEVYWTSTNEELLKKINKEIFNLDGSIMPFSELDPNIFILSIELSKIKMTYEFGGDFQSGVYAMGGSLQAHGIEVGDTFVRTISGGIQKVKDKNGKIVYINLSTGERDSQPPLPFKDGGGVQDGIEEDIDMTDDYVLRVRKPAMPNRKLSNLELAEKHNSGAYEFMGKDKMTTGGALVGNQKRIDMNKNGKIDAEDFKLLRSSMNGAWRNERKHVNHNEDYEVRYARKKPARTGYKGKRKFGDGGGISNFERLSRVVAKNYKGKRVKPQYQKEYGKVYSKSEAKEVGDKVAGKVKANQKMNTGGETKKGAKGGIMVLAKKIRKEGESWQDALKRAGQQLK
jgi:hypothetical protein